MAYNRRNILTRISKIQEITLEHTRKGVTQEWVFKNVIYPNYTISRRTYYNWLGTPAKQELKKLEAQPKQMCLFQ
jgi:hypothetical protein